MLNSILQLLPHIPQFHKRDCKIYNDLYVDMREYMYMLFHDTSYSLHPLAQPRKISFGSFFIRFPYLQMGDINTIDLFDLDELIIFSFYLHNRHRYKKVLDIGANVGLHSIILDKLGYYVTAFEPDIHHYKELCNNIKLNDCVYITTKNQAISNITGYLDFIRVLNNTTANHLSGSRSYYGPNETTSVNVTDIKDLRGLFDLIKLDAEGHEAIIIQAMSHEFLDKTDIILEINNQENAQIIWDYCQSSCHIQSQKTGWKDVKSINDMPTNYKEGSVFISGKGNCFYEN